MKAQPPPRIGDRLFLFHREVIVTKTYLTFRLVKIRSINEIAEFCIVSEDVNSFIQSVSEVSPQSQIIMAITLNSRELIHIIDGLDTDKYHKLEIADKAFKRFEKMGSKEVSN